MNAFLLLLCVYFAHAYNEIPIVGVLSQESYAVDKFFPDEHYDSYIAASYVKLVEAAGARVVPILVGQKKDYYRKIVKHTNGVLFPGGTSRFNRTKGYAAAGQILYDLALEANRNGDYYPIWGTCLGMELLAHVAVRGQELRADCSAKKVSLPLEFKKDFFLSKIFRGAPEEIVQILQTKNVTYNNHKFCVTEGNFTRFGLDKNWRTIATNRDVKGFEFISVFESKLYPFYGVQFHPEKNPYEFKKSLKIPHSKAAVQVSQYFANFFVEETRRNDHAFSDWKSEQEALIYNYLAHFIGRQNSSYEQVYMFKNN